MMIENLLRKLVTIESPSGKEERLVSFLMDYLKNEGFRAVVQEEKLENINIKNIIVNPDSELWIVTHMDTVPIKSEYSFDGKYAYGTGVCDPKGSIASILTALKKIKKLNIGLAFLSDEEEGGKGSEILLKDYRLDKAIVMEPTTLKIANRHYGCFEIEVTVSGTPIHASVPHEGDNAIEKSLRMIDELRKTKYSFSVLEIGGGGNIYVIPDKCKTRLDFIFPPEISIGVLKEIILPIAERYGDVSIVEEWNGFIAENFPLLEHALKKAGIGVRYTEMPSWTDAINLKNSGCKVVVWGPGELKYCHTPNERVEIGEIEKAAEVIFNLNDKIGN